MVRRILKRQLFLCTRNKSIHLKIMTELKQVLLKDGRPYILHIVLALSCAAVRHAGNPQRASP